MPNRLDPAYLDENMSVDDAREVWENPDDYPADKVELAGRVLTEAGWK